MSDLFTDLQSMLQEQGPEAAIEHLCEQLKSQKEYDHLFYARLMAQRYKLGLSPVPTAPATDIPDEKQTQFEETIRNACQEVGQLYLQESNLPQAWMYYRMIGETAPMEKALSEYVIDEEDENAEEVIQIAFHEGILPKKGFDWVLDRFGLCSAITTLGSQQIPGGDDVRNYCVGQAARVLYEELRERLIADISEREGQTPPEADTPPGTFGVVRKLIEKRPELFGEHAYHVDLSHLNSVVQMAMELPAGEDLEIVRELCEYGEKLSSDYQPNAEPPFDETYKDYAMYLSTIAGEQQEEGIDHFRKKMEKFTIEEYGSGSTEIFIQLLNRLGKHKEAAEVACEYLAEIDNPQLSYVAGLCEQAKAYDTLSKAAKHRQHPVQYLAGLLGKSQQ